MRIKYKKIDAPADGRFLHKLSKLVSRFENPLILGGNGSSRFSYFGFGPVEIYEFNENSHTHPFDELSHLLDKCKVDVNPDLPAGMFVGGWAGYFSYELGRYIEKLPQTTIDDLHMPIIRLGFYDKVIAFDSAENCCYLITLTDDENLNLLEQVIIDSSNESAKNFNDGDMEKIDVASLNCNMSKAEYVNALAKIKQYIYDGDVYQINFSKRYDTSFNGEPVELFGWQNEHNPSPYSAYMSFSEFAIVSTSPEMFVTIVGDKISTKPIKGTRKFIKGDEQANRKNYRDLLCCEKEKAELNMIIDLERNDLGRICVPGTIKVCQSRTIEQYATVYHGVATVEGIMKEDADFCDVLWAMFPGGSITGAPKIRAMEIIDELETTQRGVYTGCIGYIGADGNACLNIAIRTIIITARKAYFQAGGGIVADSDAEFEWQECLTKARAMAAGIKTVSIF
jgi:para-aminobenzoate synthetase component 1